MELYEEHAGKSYYPALILAMSSGYCRMFVLEAENAVAEVRKINGPTNPANAAEGTIRKDISSSGGPFNVVHTSDSTESFKRELAVVIGVHNRIAS